MSIAIILGIFLAIVLPILLIISFVLLCMELHSLIKQQEKHLKETIEWNNKFKR